MTLERVNASNLAYEGEWRSLRFSSALTSRQSQAVGHTRFPGWTLRAWSILIRLADTARRRGPAGT